MDKIVFDLEVNEMVDGIELISIVYNPAYKSSFIALSENENNTMTVELSAFDERQELTGAVMIPDQEVYVGIVNGKHKYIRATEANIKEFKKRFIQNGNLSQSNLQHSQK